MYRGRLQTIEHDGYQEIVLPPDNLDATNVHSFKEWLVDNGKKNLLINMENVKFLDSSGLGAIIGAMRHLRTKGYWVKMLSPNKSVMAVLELMKMNRILDIYNTRDEIRLT